MRWRDGDSTSADAIFALFPLLNKWLLLFEWTRWSSSNEDRIGKSRAECPGPNGKWFGARQTVTASTTSKQMKVAFDEAGDRQETEIKWVECPTYLVCLQRGTSAKPWPLFNMGSSTRKPWRNYGTWNLDEQHQFRPCNAFAPSERTAKKATDDSQLRIVTTPRADTSATLAFRSPFQKKTRQWFVRPSSPLFLLSSIQTNITKNPPTQQLDKLVGLAMLVAASVVFLYYTIWTLLMVTPLHPSFPLSQLTRNQKQALRRLGPPAPKLLPAPRLGDPHPRDPAAVGLGRGRLLPQRRHDPQQPQEGGQGGGQQEKGVKERTGPDPHLSASLSNEDKPQGELELGGVVW